MSVHPDRQGGDDTVLGIAQLRSIAAVDEANRHVPKKIDESGSREALKKLAQARSNAGQRRDRREKGEKDRGPHFRAKPLWLLTERRKGLISYLFAPGDVRMIDSRDVRIKRLRFRSWHRGTREMDLLLGRFADRHLGQMREPELSQYEALLDVADADLYNWLVGVAPIPLRFDNQTLALIKDFKLDHLML